MLSGTQRVTLSVEVDLDSTGYGLFSRAEDWPLVLQARLDELVGHYKPSVNVAPESFTIEQIQAAFANNARPDDWGVKAFYETTLIAALRGQYDNTTTEEAR